MTARCSWLTLSALSAMLGAGPCFSGEGTGLPRLYTNEQFVADVTQRSNLDVESIPAVLAYVLGELPARVSVFPTENYYYFYFYQDGVRYAGNFRFDVDERDKGLVEFVYFRDTTDWAEDEAEHHATLGTGDGVSVEKVAELSYAVSFAGKRVLFELNDLSKVEPPPGVMTRDEAFLGPVADESGLRFFLIFDSGLKVFHYVLDETVPLADELIAVPRLSHILVGRRTGFAFFHDGALKRNVLIAVYGANEDMNNYLDGPFDQLPDNFLKGDVLRDAILAAYPDLKTPIDRLGISPERDYRQSISPYMSYADLLHDLAPAEECAAKADAPAVYACLNALF